MSICTSAVFGDYLPDILEPDKAHILPSGRPRDFTTGNLLPITGKFDGAQLRPGIAGIRNDRGFDLRRDSRRLGAGDRTCRGSRRGEPWRLGRIGYQDFAGIRRATGQRGPPCQTSCSNQQGNSRRPCLLELFHLLIDRRSRARTTMTCSSTGAPGLRGIGCLGVAFRLTQCLRQKIIAFARPTHY